MRAWIVAALALLLPLGPAARPDARIAADEIDALARPVIDAQLTVGLALGVIAGGETFVQGYGRVDATSEETPDGDTIFEIGSVSKVFTSLLLADAVTRGKLALDAPVAGSLPAQDSAEFLSIVGSPVRFVHLATHTSGLPRMPGNFAPRNPADPYVDYGGDLLVDGLARTRLFDEPGLRYEYSNLAVGLLGHVLVHVNGAADYGALLEERICGPLGLGDTGVTIAGENAGRFAPAYDADLRPTHHWNFGALAGAGAIRSTVHDLLRFARAQLEPDGTPLAEAIRLTHPLRHSFGEGKGGVALGWHVSPVGSLWHNGQVGGHHAFLAVNHEFDAAVAILSNAPGAGAIDRLGNELTALVCGQEAQPLSLAKPAPLPPGTLEKYAGTYALNPLMQFTLTVEDGGLYAQLTGQDAYRLYPESATRFSYRVVDARIEFELDEDGKPVALVLDQNGIRQRAERE